MVSLTRLDTVEECPGALRVPAFYAPSRYRNETLVIRSMLAKLYLIGETMARVGDIWAIDGERARPAWVTDIELPKVRINRSMIDTVRATRKLVVSVTKDDNPRQYHPFTNIVSGSFKGVADLVWLDPTKRDIHLFCYSFGYPAEDRSDLVSNIVMLRKATGLAIKRERGFIHSVWPNTGDVFTSTYEDLHHMDNLEVDQMLADIAQENAPLRSGPHCAKCPAVVHCPEFVKTIKGIPNV